MRCPEKCGGALTRLSIQTMTDGSGMVISSRCNECWNWFSKALAPEDFERD